MASIATPTSSFPSNPTTPAYTDDLEWITAYFTIHMMSDASRRYAYLLWFLILLIIIIYSIFHVFGLSGGLVGAVWSKWAMRRRTWRGEHVAQRNGKPTLPISLPPNGQLFSLSLLLFTTLALAFIGPDYISPSVNAVKFWITSPQTDSLLHARTYDLSSYYQYQPQHTISKAWWTSGGRTGIIAFALFPLCVLFALKAPPFAALAIPFLTQFHFDKLAWLHRWSGRLIWFITTLHVGLWTVQLCFDHREDVGKRAIQYAWRYDKFIYGWVAFALLTFLIILSTEPLRKRYYEAFYVLHVLLVPMTLIMSAFHHPPLWWWCWAALSVWVGERLWRATWWLHINGFFDETRIPANTLLNGASSPDIEPSSLQNADPSTPIELIAPHKPFSTPTSSHQQSLISINTAVTLHTSSHTTSYTPPPGYAHAELLSGGTIRLTFISPGFVSWAPGQHFLVNIPSVSRMTSHPFTCASVCDEQSPTQSGMAMVFLIRAKAGWTKDLWDVVATHSARYETHHPAEKLPQGTSTPKRGILLRMFVDGPYGSAVRARWGSHSTAVIVSGGSGVGFGLSILEYLCMCISGRDGIFLGGKYCRAFLTKRIRFVWLVREFSHIQWAASALRRCISLVPPGGLQIDIFVTNSEPRLSKSLNSPAAPQPRAPYGDNLAPPAPRFAREKGSRSPANSRSSSIGSDSDSSIHSFIEQNSQVREYGDEERDIGDLGIRENYALDLTNFDGDDDAALPGEDALNRVVRKAGKLRRAKSRNVEPSRPLQERIVITDRPRKHHYQRHTRERSSAGSQDGLLGSPRSSFMDQTHRPTSPPSPLVPSRLPPPSLFIHDQQIAETPISEDPRSASSLSVAWGGDLSSPRLEVADSEMRDINVVAEHARPGRPKLDRILGDEVDRSQGSIVVAFCGPTSLNALLRKCIAAQIFPARIRRGDMRGSITLVSEDFQY